MSVSGELLCSFELLKPLDSAALKQQMKKGRSQRNSMMHQSPVGTIFMFQYSPNADVFFLLQPASMAAQSY